MQINSSKIIAGALTLALAGTAFCATGMLNSLSSNYESRTRISPLGPFAVLNAFVYEPGGPIAQGGAAAFLNSNSMMKFTALGEQHFYSPNHGDWTWVGATSSFTDADVFYFTY